MAYEIVQDIYDRRVGLDKDGNFVVRGGAGIAIGGTNTTDPTLISAAEMIELAGQIPAVAVAAAGSGQSTYTALSGRINAVTAADGTKGVALPAAATSIGWILVINTVATAILPVAPVNGGNDAINGLTAGTGVYNMAPGEAAFFIPTSATQWYVRPASSVTPGTVTASLPLVPDANKDIASLRDVTVRAIKVGDSANDHTIAIQGAGDEAANRTLGIPLLGGNDTLMTLATAQTVTGVKTMSGANVITLAPTGLKVQDSDASHIVTIAPGNETADRTLAVPVMGGAQTMALLGTSGGSQAFVDRLTTTDGVASGTAKVIGGRATANVAASDTVTAATSNNSFVAFATTYAIPANTLKQGSVLRATALVVVNDASGTDTLTVELRIGGTTLIATTAVDPGAVTDLHLLEFEFTARAAPAAAASCVGGGRWVTNTGGTIAHGTGLLAPTNFATNGALTLDVRAKWSSNTASTSARLEMLNVNID